MLVSTDSERIAEIARRYGAEVPGLRPAEIAGARSPDIEWVRHVMAGRDEALFSILRPTSPFRTAATIRRAWDALHAVPDADSVRAIRPVKEHPGKMWRLEGELMVPLLEQVPGEVPTHSRQFADLPEVFVQDSSLEIAWTRIIARRRDRRRARGAVPHRGARRAVDRLPRGLRARPSATPRERRLPEIRHDALDLRPARRARADPRAGGPDRRAPRPSPTRSGSTRCLRIMEAGSGHIGTSFSVADILAWLHLEVLDGDDVCFSSKGHDAPAVYAALAGAGKLDFELLHRLRRLDGLPGHPDIHATPQVHTNTGSLGMGISKAKGFARAARLDGRRRRVFVITGDGELQEGQFWESLGQAANEGFGEITAIVDHNKIQSDTWVEHVSDLGDLEAKVRAFGWEVARCDGNDIAALARTLTELLESERPKLLIADTVKGAGASVFIAARARASPARRCTRTTRARRSEDVYGEAIAELAGGSRSGSAATPSCSRRRRRGGSRRRRRSGSSTPTATRCWPPASASRTSSRSTPTCTWTAA